VYLLRLHGVEVDETSRSGFAPDFLMQQMVWRESLEALRGSAGSGPAREQLLREVQESRDQQLAVLERLIDGEQRFEAAAGPVRQLMFLERFIEQIEAEADDLA
jgi:molecular chaperone HscB